MSFPSHYFDFASADRVSARPAHSDRARTDHRSALRATGNRPHAVQEPAGPTPVRTARRVVATLALLVPWPHAFAAESYDNCTGFIDSLPATVTTSGTWCLRANLSTAMSSGAAITLAANNITLDCNDFRIGGLAAGVGTFASAVVSSGVENVTIRQCGIRGFRFGITVGGGLLTAPTSGHLIEDNRLDQNTVLAMRVFGSDYIVRRNRIIDTGGAPGMTLTIGIQAFGTDAVIADNLVSGITIDNSNGFVRGISADQRAVVTGNTVMALAPTGTGSAIGLSVSPGPGIVRNNQFINPVVDDIAILANGSLCSGNLSIGYLAIMSGCTDAGGNLAD